MFCCVASVTLVVLALCASTASAGFDWAAVSSKGSMQTGDVRLFLLLSVERERERDHQQQRVFLARGDRKNAPNRETVRGRPPRLSSALSETPAGALFVFDARKFADSFSTSTSVRVSLSSSSLSLSLSLSNFNSTSTKNRPPSTATRKGKIRRAPAPSPRTLPTQTTSPGPRASPTPSP